MATARQFFEWLEASGCSIIRPGSYGVQFSELWQAYEAQQSTGRDQFPYLDLIRMQWPEHIPAFDPAEGVFSKDQIRLFDEIDAGLTVWPASEADCLRQSMHASEAWHESEASYARRRQIANEALADRRRRIRILSRDGYQCRQCGSTGDLTIDHIQAVRNGGDDSDANLQTLCRSCNSSKGAR